MEMYLARARVSEHFFWPFLSALCRFLFCVIVFRGPAAYYWELYNISKPKKIQKRGLWIIIKLLHWGSVYAIIIYNKLMSDKAGEVFWAAYKGPLFKVLSMLCCLDYKLTNKR